VIAFRNVSFSYRPGEPVLRRASLSIGAGLTLLVGPNGSGKSTVLKIAAGVERPETGSAEIEGHDLWRDEVAARRNLVYVPEQPELTPYATIADVIRLVCRLRAEPLERGREALEAVGLGALGRRSIRELSMGQRRRAVLAAAWIGAPRVVLLDEPLEAMDRAIRERIADWVDRLRVSGAAVVIATHEIEPFVGGAGRVVSLVAGACEVREPLPAVLEARGELIERLARGLDRPRPEA
jgi:ABC-type multidrug transport system ATPase subunit